VRCRAVCARCLAGDIDTGQSGFSVEGSGVSLGGRGGSLLRCEEGDVELPWPLDSKREDQDEGI
jgi:hypothetical protein